MSHKVYPTCSTDEENQTELGLPPRPPWKWGTPGVLSPPHLELWGEVWAPFLLCWLAVILSPTGLIRARGSQPADPLPHLGILCHMG